MTINRVPRVAQLVTDLATTQGVLSVEFSLDRDTVHASIDFMLAAAKAPDAEIRIEPFPSLPGVWRAVMDHEGVRFFATLQAEDLSRFGYQLNGVGQAVPIPTGAVA